jgi:hypothetical protein
MSAMNAATNLKMGARPWKGTLAFWLSAAAVVGAAIATVVFVNQAAPSSSSKDDVDKAMKNITYTNGALILFMTILAYVYLRQFPDTRDNYMMIITHFSLFLSFLAVSIAVITKRV